MSYKLYTYIIFYLFVVMTSVSYAGFDASTLVLQENALTCISNLQRADMVYGQNQQGDVGSYKILVTKNIQNVPGVRIGFSDDVYLCCSKDQLFYLPDIQIWKTAQELVVGDRLRGFNSNFIEIIEIALIAMVPQLYDICVDEAHNFFVTSKLILVHNFLPVWVSAWVISICSEEIIKLALLFGATGFLRTQFGIAVFSYQKSIQFGIDLRTHQIYNHPDLKKELQARDPQEKKNVQKDSNKGSNSFNNSGSAPSPNDKDPKNDKNKLNEKKDILAHIFTDKAGHVIDTPENRKLFQEIANEIKNFLGKDIYGNEWFAKILSDGKQAWVRVYQKIIRSAGVNEVAREMHPVTGLCEPKVPSKL